MAKRNRKKAGLPPGSIIFTGKKKIDKIDIHYLEYNEQDYKVIDHDNHSISELFQASENYIQWYDIRGLHDVELIQAIGDSFKIHPLILEDVVDTHQRPKYEEFDNGIIIIIKALTFDPVQTKILSEQVSLYMGPGFVLSFQEKEDDLFNALRNRIHLNKGRIRKRGADYLAYALIDIIMDSYYIVLDELELYIEKLEANILEQSDANIKGQIHQVKQEMLIVRKAIAPLREAISRFAKSENELIDDNTKLYIRDLYDHNVQLLDMTETYRDMLNSLQDLYLSEISFKMNQVMQVLTVITTIFVPLAFLSGLYGMNFENMPELHWKYGYFVLLTVMASIAIGSLVWFKKKGWF